MLTILQVSPVHNPWFYHIGYTLYEHGQANKLTEFALRSGRL